MTQWQETPQRVKQRLEDGTHGIWHDYDGHMAYTQQTNRRLQCFCCGPEMLRKIDPLELKDDEKTAESGDPLH